VGLGKTHKATSALDCAEATSLCSFEGIAALTPDRTSEESVAALLVRSRRDLCHLRTCGEPCVQNFWNC